KMKKQVIYRVDLDYNYKRQLRKPIDYYIQDVLDERQDVQKKTFTKWINAHLSKTTCPLVKDLFLDLRDGHKLLALLEILTNTQYKPEKGRMRVHHINNLNKALQVLQENGVKLLNISSEDIVAGNKKLTLGLIWIIALCFDGQKLVNSQAVSGIEKSLLNWVRQYTEPHGLIINDFSTSWSDGLAFLYILDGNVPDFDLNAAKKLHPIARFRIAFDLAAQHLQIDQLLDPEDVNTNKPDKKSILMYVMCLYHAIDARKIDQGSIQNLVQHFGSTEEIELLNEVEMDTVRSDDNANEAATPVIKTFHVEEAHHVGNVTDLDEISLNKSIENIDQIPSPSTMKRSATFTILKTDDGGKEMETDSHTEESVGTFGGDTNSRPQSYSNSRPQSTATNASIEIGSYQHAIEVVLSLLLEAEEVLSKDLASVTDLNEAKQQFQDHEDFMIKLSEYQQYVGSALEEGARLMSESQQTTGLTSEDQNEIKQQMFLLNERWETLRMKALNVQSKIHARLAKVQLEKIEELRFSLTITEDKISRMPDVSCNPDEMKKQLDEHRLLERSLDDQRALVDSLSNLVVIVNDDSFSELEDKLAALGERWSHVVKWTKNRWESLQEVSVKWKLLTDRYTVVCKWMDTRERDLKAMEGMEVTEIGSVMKRMNDLRYCGKDLDVLSEYLTELEGVALALKPASSNLLDKMENLNDRCEALKQIVEIQQSRIESMGFSFPAASKDASLDRPISWIDFQWKFQQNSEPAPLDVEMSPQSNKKRKIQKSDALRNIESKIQEMAIFIENSDAKLEDIWKLSLNQQSTLLTFLNEDLKRKIQEFLQVKAQLEECRATCDVSEEEERLSNVGSKYDELGFTLENLLAIHRKKVMKDKLHNNLMALKLTLADCRDWFKQHSNKASKEDLQNRLSCMDKFSGDINEAKTAWSTEMSTDLKEWKRDFDQFYSSWFDLRSALVRLLQEQGGVEDVSALRRELEDFVSETEETYVVVDDMERMNENLEKLENLKVKYTKLQELHDYISDKISQSSENDDLFEVWSKLPNLINERTIKQNTSIENLKHFNNEFNEILHSLSQLESILCEDVFILGEFQTLREMSDRYESHISDIKRIEIDIISVKNFSEIIAKDGEDDHKRFLAKKIKDVNDRYTKIIDLYQQNSKRLHQVRTQTESVILKINQMDVWLNDLAMNTPKCSNSDITNSNELFQIKTKFQSLKETCEHQTIAFRELNEMGNEMLIQIDDLNQMKSGKKYSYLAKEFTKLNARWNEITSIVYNRTALLEHISCQLGEFKTFVVGETAYLDKLEKCLRKSPQNAADAEEMYEELDDLENNIRNHSDDRLEKIQEIAAELVEHKIMVTSITDEVRNITDRWQLLQHQAKQREQMLQRAVSEAQTSETRVSTMQQWISRVDCILKEHLENDTTMEDLPHDFQRLIDEFDNNEELLKDMHEEVKSHQQKGKQEAAHRLQEQVDLLQHEDWTGFVGPDDISLILISQPFVADGFSERFLSCKDKLSSFTSPQAAFETRLNRAVGELRSVERNSCILDVQSAGPSNVQDQCQHCLKMYRTLSEIKPEIESVIKTGRKICEDRTTKNPKKLSQSIDALKHLYNALGEHVTQSKNILEKLLKLANGIEDNINGIDKWLEDSNKDLKHICEIEKLLEQCNRMYDEYKESCDAIYLEEVREKIDELETKFSVHSNKGSLLKKLREMSSTLQNLDSISLDTLRTMEKDLEDMDTTNPSVKELHKEVQEAVKIGLSSKTRLKETNTEIVVVSDTVRQRRSRTPMSSENSDKIITETESTESRSNVLPDLLPTTFRLAESSSLFSQISVDEIANSEEIDANRNHEESGDDDVSVVEIREGNLTPKMQVRISNQELEHMAKIEDVTNTISIIETVETFEPEFVETVNIVYASDASSCSTPVMGDREDMTERENTSYEANFDDLEEEFDGEIQEKSSSGTILVEKQRLSQNEGQPSFLMKERDLLKDSENDKIERMKHKRIIAPALKEILSYQERDSFYGSDKENFDDPLVFSEDEDIPRFSLEMNADVDSDSDTVLSFIHLFSIQDNVSLRKTSKVVNIIELQFYFQGRIETPNSAKSTGQQNKFPDLTATSMVSKNSISLEQRVFEFDKTAKYMIRKLEATRQAIERCDEGAEAIEHLKLSIAPDAATLISQGDTLVLETHGKSTELSATVMKTQSLLREKFREMKHARFPKTIEEWSAEHLQKAPTIQPENHNLPKEKSLNEKQLLTGLKSELPRRMSDDSGVRKLIETINTLISQPINHSLETELLRHVEVIRDRQEDLKVAMDVSPRSKATMESLERAKRELSSHCDAIKLSLANLNRAKEWQFNENSPSYNPSTTPNESFNGSLKSENKSEAYVPGSFTSKAKAKFFANTPIVPDASFDVKYTAMSNWLDTNQTMLKKQSVEVGDIDAILIATKRQKEVLRELEIKKPQLEELVQTAESLKTDANRQELHLKDPIENDDQYYLFECNQRLKILVAFMHKIKSLTKIYSMFRPIRNAQRLSVYRNEKLFVEIG
ncbi:Dystrophin, isoforms A/C/F/G/H, partial [Pseudolycoriella hygida]